MNIAKLSARERFSGCTVLNPLFNHKAGELNWDSSYLILTLNSGEDLSEESCQSELLGTQLEKEAKFILETHFSFSTMN